MSDPLASPTGDCGQVKAEEDVLLESGLLLSNKKRKLNPEAETEGEQKNVVAQHTNDPCNPWQNQAMDYHLPGRCSRHSSGDHRYDARCSNECPISPETSTSSSGSGSVVDEDGDLDPPSPSCPSSSFDSQSGSSWKDPAQPKDLTEWLSMFSNWTETEKSAALESLSELCDLQQLRHLLALIEPQLQRDFISLLPKELSLFVLSYLDPPDLLRAAQTCRYWRVLCEDNLLWREKCKEEGLLDDTETITDLFKKRMGRRQKTHLLTFSPHGRRHHSACGSKSGNNSSNNASGSSTGSQHHSSSSRAQLSFLPSVYKTGYLRQKSIEFNWRYGTFPVDAEADAAGHLPPQELKARYLKEILQLKGHDDHVITCLQFNPASNLIVSGSDDNTLKVWSSSTGKCLKTLTGHTGGVWSSQLSPSDIVISGSTDRTLKVWNAISGECLHTLYGHTSTVRCMALNGDLVVSGSRDATLRVWDTTTGECRHVLTGHVAAVRCVQFDGRIVVSGAYDYQVKVWDAHTETLLHTLSGHTNRVYSLQFDGENIVSGSLDTSIRVWSSSTGVLRHTLVGHQSLTSGMQLRGNVLVSGNADSTVKVWDINTGRCLQTLAGPHKHLSAVTCLQFNSRFVITSSDDGTVKLWDLKTGDFIRNLVQLPSGGSGGVVWRIRSSNTRLVCAVGSRNGTEETKLLVLDFDPDTETRPQRLPFTPTTLMHQCVALDEEDIDDIFMEAGSNSSDGLLGVGEEEEEEDQVAIEAVGGEEHEPELLEAASW